MNDYLLVELLEVLNRYLDLEPEVEHSERAMRLREEITSLLRQGITTEH